VRVRNAGPAVMGALAIGTQSIATPMNRTVADLRTTTRL
jgi:hypothetical protein